MRFLIYGILSFLTCGLLLRIDLGGVGLQIYDILLPLFSIIFLFNSFFISRKIYVPKILKPFFIFIIFAIFSFLLNAYLLDFKEIVISSAYIIRLVNFAIFAIAVFQYFHYEKDGEKTSQKSHENFLNYFFILWGIILILAFLQFKFLPDISKFSTEGGWDPHVGRLLGTWLDPNYLAGALGFLLPLICAKFYYSQNFREKFWLVILLVMGLLGLFLTFSRSGYLAGGIGLLFFFLFKDWKIILLAVLICCLGILNNERAQKRLIELSGTFKSIILSDTDEIDPTASLRIQNWQKSFTLFQKNPLIGIGYNTYRFRASEEGIVDENYFSAGGADSTHLTILITTGIIGFLLYLWFLLNFIWQHFRQYFFTITTSGIRNEKIMNLGIAAGILSLIVHACFVNSLFFPLIFLPVLSISVLFSEK